MNTDTKKTDILDYERLYDAGAISKSIYTLPGESVLIRNAFRWKRDGVVVSNAYEMQDMEQVCQDRGWEIVVRYGDHIAIIRHSIGDQ